MSSVPSTCFVKEGAFGSATGADSVIPDLACRSGSALKGHSSPYRGDGTVVRLLHRHEVGAQNCAGRLPSPDRGQCFDKAAGRARATLETPKKGH